MNIKILKLILVLSIISSLAVACVIKKEVVKFSPLPKKNLLAIGYGTVEHDRLNTAQRRLMGMRASKMEAYRALAEQLYGVRLNSNTTIENMVVKNDSYRSFIDAVVRGARIKRITAIDADTYETVMEIDLTPQFFECFGSSEAALNRCLNSVQGIPLSGLNEELQVLHPMARSAACNSIDCYGYPNMQGFSRTLARPGSAVEKIQGTSGQLLAMPVQGNDGILAMAGFR